MRSIPDWLSRWTANRQQQRERRRAVRAAQDRRKQALVDAAASPLQRLLFWGDQAPVTDPPGQDIGALEERYSIRLPDDFRRYLLATMPHDRYLRDDGALHP